MRRLGVTASSVVTVRGVVGMIVHSPHCRSAYKFDEEVSSDEIRKICPTIGDANRDSNRNF